MYKKFDEILKIMKNIQKFLFFIKYKTIRIKLSVALKNGFLSKQDEINYVNS